MKTDTTETAAASDDLPNDVLFDVLADRRRRYLLHYLSGRVGAVDVCDAAEQIALWEDDDSNEQYERVLTGLLHHHVPVLSDAGLVRYDPILETVTLRRAADQAAPYLKLATPGDFG